MFQGIFHIDPHLWVSKLKKYLIIILLIVAAALITFYYFVVRNIIYLIVPIILLVVVIGLSVRGSKEVGEEDLIDEILEGY